MSCWDTPTCVPDIGWSKFSLHGLVIITLKGFDRSIMCRCKRTKQLSQQPGEKLPLLRHRRRRHRFVPLSLRPPFTSIGSVRPRPSSESPKPEYKRAWSAAQDAQWRFRLTPIPVSSFATCSPKCVVHHIKYQSDTVTKLFLRQIAFLTTKQQI